MKSAPGWARTMRRPLRGLSRQDLIGPQLEMAGEGQVSERATSAACEPRTRPE